ncbi:MAG TPA: fibronectin type III domain-containing protein [Bacteroidales bacterium]|nr:fibronectin type III domain-containing protein [Bacteroidales bacterium]
MRRNPIIIFCVLIGIIFFLSCISDSGEARTRISKPRCGDRICNGTETCKTCPKDCGICPPPAPYCGDGSCNGTETCKICQKDCGVCPPAPSLNIILTWNANAPEENVINYKIYYGYQSGVYAGSYDVGVNLSLALTLEQQKVYYFSATAVNAVGESDHSNEITYSTMYNYW